METLLAISKSIVSDKYIDEILSLIVQLMAELTGFTICSIMLLNDKKNELVIKATQSLDKDYLEKPAVKLGQSISGKAVMEQRTIRIKDVRLEKDFMFPELAKKLGLCSMLCVPMMIKNKVIGVINSYTKQFHDFSDEEVKIMQTIALQTATAIENTRLLDEIVHTKQELELRKLIERAKGILMKELKLDEEQAYKIIHKKSMDTGKSMRTIAEAIIISNTIKNNK